MTLDLDLRPFPPLIFEVVEEVANLDGGDVVEMATYLSKFGEPMCSLLNSISFRIWRGTNEEIEWLEQIRRDRTE